jgi:hypothetical protein
MNERIRQLALEARLGPALLLYYWENIDALTDSEQEDLEKIEKFAELIVKECVTLADTEAERFSNLDQEYCAMAMDNYRELVLKHFGVEE